MSLFSKHNLAGYLSGNGIEIGALNNPLPVDCKRCRVTYVDRLDKEGLTKHNPTVSNEKIKVPDVVGDAMDLHMFADNSVDFVIFSHVLEHLPNPLKALKEFHRVLKPGGILYLGIPDKRFTFDVERPVTSLAHVIADFRKDAKETDDLSHYEEWFRMVELKRPPQSRWELKDLVANQCTIHFHVWVAESIMELLEYMKNELKTCFRLKDYYYRQGDVDMVFILEKSDASLPQAGFPSRLEERYSPARIIMSKALGIASKIIRLPARVFRKIRS